MDSMHRLISEYKKQKACFTASVSKYFTTWYEVWALYAGIKNNSTALPNVEQLQFTDGALQRDR